MNNAFKYSRLSKDAAACLLVDHQSGPISLVQDFSPGEFKNNVLALADCAKYFKLPTISMAGAGRGLTICGGLVRILRHRRNNVR